MTETIATINGQDVTLARFTARELPDVYRWQILAILRVYWPLAFTGERALPRTIFQPDWPSTHVVIAAGETIIAHAGYVLLDRQHAGETYRVAGLGGVVSFPDYRGQGYGRRAVAEATRQIDGMGADAAALFCTHDLAPFYAREGWIAMPEAVTQLGDHVAPHLEPELRMMRFLTERGRAARSAFAAIPWHLTTRW